VASRLAVDILRERLGGGAANLDVVVAAVAEANAAIFSAAHANADQRGMGTTLTAIALIRDIDDDQFGADAEQLVLVNVGDSRAYVHRDGVLRRASIDHSYVQELVATGHITEAEARTHPRRNIVTRALGIEPQVRVDTWTLRLVLGDRYVLCSDGLVDEVDDTEIEEVLNRIEDPQEAAEELVALANVHGGRDNVTVVVVDVLTGVDPKGLRPAAAPTADMDETVVADVGADDTATGVSEADGAPAPLLAGDELGDPAATASTTLVTAGAAATAPKKQRKMTGRMFLVLLAIAAVLTVAIVLLAVALNGDDSHSPTPSTPSSTSALPSTLASTTTVAPTTTAATTTVAVTTTVAAATTTAGG
jgi:serine/threonine protein phosphatase PrpC